jgi:RNA polymerase sigma factor for flagellar operon FliA
MTILDVSYVTGAGWEDCSNCRSEPAHLNHKRWLAKELRKNPGSQPDQDLWVRVKEGDLDARDIIVLQNIGLVERLARKFSRSLPQHVDVNDLVSYGFLGLMRAISRYDPARGVNFETFAAASVKSLILDELRRLDWAPRSLRKKQRDLKTAQDELREALGREPSRVEVAAKLEWEVTEISTTVSKTTASYHRSLDEGDFDRDWASGENAGPSGLEVDSKQVVYALTAFRDVIREMPALDQVVLVLRYYEGFKLAAVGRELGITESKASQIHSRAVLAVREQARRLLEAAPDNRT